MEVRDGDPRTRSAVEGALRSRPDNGSVRRVLGGAPDLTYIPSIITDDVVGYWPGGRVVRGAEQYMRALEELLTLLPDLHLEVPEHTMSAGGEFGFSRWVMHATGANGPFELVGMDRTRIRDGRVCENYAVFDSRQFEELVGK